MKKLIIMLSILLCVSLVGCTNSNGDSGSKSDSEQVISGVADITIGTIEPTEMDAAYSASADLTKMKPNAKVSGSWSFQIEGVGNSNPPECNADLKSCVAYFPSNKLKIGQQYKMTVTFNGKIDNTPVNLSKDKQFTAEELKSQD